MAYTVFDDDAGSPVPKKAPKSSPKKVKSLEKRVNGHAHDDAPVASTSKAILPPANLEDTAEATAAGEGETTAVFKKRKASVTGGPDGKSKSKRRSLDGEGSPEVDASELSARTKNAERTASGTDISRETVATVPSRRVATFYADEDQMSEGEEAGTHGKSRAIETRPGESKKQARKRFQTEQKEKATHLLAAREKLPVYAVKNAILKEIEARDTVVILGETGSGKTTQIPQFLLSSQICRPQPRIAVTQPRRVAATSLARRVSEEYGCTLGSVVGYTVRFDDCSSPRTRLKYLTDGTLLQEILGDRLLESYDVVVIDEAHERTLRTDMILGFLKEIQVKRKEMARTAEKGKNGEPVGPLKIVVMSATIDAERFSDFFDHAKILFVKGRTYNVKTMYLQEATQDYIEAALKCIFQIHYTCPPGDVLVFLAGQDEIESLKAQIENYLPTLDPKKMQLLVCPLYARLTPSEQNKAFSMAPPNTRKVILATNVAETSITISGIKYVIDTGMQKEKTYHPTTGMDSLLLKSISKNSATQRAGRAGRESAGTCFRLYTEKAYLEMPKALLPEIQRCSLAFALLHLLAYGQDDVTKFNFMDRPSNESSTYNLVDSIPSLIGNSPVASALMELYGLGATDERGRITDVGRQMAALPLEPAQAKVLLASFENHCSVEIIDLLSLLGSADAILSVPFQHREAASAARSKFIHRSGDHMMLLNILKAYEEICESLQTPKERRAWCNDHFLSIKTLNQVLDARQQLRDRVNRLDPSLDCTLSAGDNDEPVLSCLLAGLFSNTAMRMPDDRYRRTTGSMRLKIHPSSILHGRKVDAIVFSELTFTSNLYARIVSTVPLIWLRTKITTFSHHDLPPQGSQSEKKMQMAVD